MNKNSQFIRSFDSFSFFGALQRFSDRHRVALALGVIVLVAAGLRLYRLDFQSLGVDEIASMNGSDPDLSIPSVIQYSMADQPPAFFLLLHGWLLFFPFTDFSGRMPALIIGLAGTVAIFFLGREVKGSQVGLIAAAITSVNFIHIMFSQEVRFYTLVFLASTLSFLFFIRALRTAKVSDYLFYSLSTSLLLYTHYYGLVVLASQGIIFLLMLVFYPGVRRHTFRATIFGLMVVAVVSPWIPVFLRDAQATAFWIQAEPFYFPLRYFYIYFKDIVSCLAFGALIIYYLVALVRNLRSGRSVGQADFILLGGVVLGFLIPLTYSIARTPMLHVRYSMIVVPLIIVVISLGFTLLSNYRSRLVLGATCITTVLTLFFVERYYFKPQKEDWKGMVTLVSASVAPGDVIVSPHSWYCNYYFKSLGSSSRAIQDQEFTELYLDRPAVWWLDAFDTGPARRAMEQSLLQNGYSLKRADTLFRARAAYYVKQD